MSKERVRTQPNILNSSPLHQQAIETGRDHFFSWQYNVMDHFKGKTVEQIKNCLEETSFPYAVCFENLIHDMNIGTGIRNANAFNAKEVFYIGDRKLDKRGVMGCANYMNIKWLPTIEDFIQLKTKYKIVGFDNIEKAKPINDYVWEPNTMIVFGSESIGLSPIMQSLCEEFVYIPQFGSVRSINVGCASAIAMNSIVSQFRK